MKIFDFSFKTDPAQIPRKYRANTAQIPRKYRANTAQMARKYRANGAHKKSPEWHRAWDFGSLNL